mgnify:CR=1 FL=1
MIDLSSETPERIFTLTSELMKNEGFLLVCEFHEARVKDLEKRILDSSTSDDETHDLKQQLKVMRDYSPSACAEIIKSKNGSKVKDYGTTGKAKTR